MTTAATTTRPTSYNDLCAAMHELGTLGSISALVGWDQETYMPPKGTEARSDQSALLAKLMHERATDPKLGEMISVCESDPDLQDPTSAEFANVREMRIDYDKATKLPGDLVSALAKAQSKAQDVWKGARKNNDFKSFVPALTEVMSLTRRKGECLGIPEGGELYDALLNEYEPNATAAQIESIFTPLRGKLSAFIQEVADNGDAPDVSFVHREIPTEKQHGFGMKVIKAFGFDMDRGRLDTTTHPFCSGFAPGDTRLTTRYSLTNFPDAIGSTMHECGHGLYEQGLPKETGDFGTPLTQAISLGIHESQSRMWENMVGRSRAFWSWALPIAKEMFSPTMDDVALDPMVRAMNTCTPSFIRVESDEATYNLHVMLRFELERAMISGDLDIKDLPEAWNTKFKDMLGLDVPDDARGCLQDVHWSFGLVGYFPTYTLGNLYAAQMWETINDTITDLDDQMAKGQFGELLAWTRAHIHVHGRRYSAGEIIERATGRALDPEPLMRHLESRVRPAYGL